MLDERKRKILQAIIDDYINTGEPVGSRTIAKKYIFGLSSATIRNEMSDLEELGFLEQPHTSAGRIPSDKGYRYYVDELMQVQDLQNQEIEYIKNILDTSINEIDEYMGKIARLISEITNYTAVISTPTVKKSFLKHIQLISVDDKRFILILVTNTGIVKNTILTKPKSVKSKDFTIITNILNQKLSGLMLEQIDENIIGDVEKELGENSEILFPIIDIIIKTISAADDTEVLLSGAKNIFDFPEFNDVFKAKVFLHIFEQKDLLRQILRTYDLNDVTIRIGKENSVDDMKECSIILSSYKIGDSIAGTLGIIGPKRLKYSQTISLVDFICDEISSILTRLFIE